MADKIVAPFERVLIVTRNEAMEHLLKACQWDQAARIPLGGDASTRSYTRLRAPNKKTALLMDAPPAAETTGCPRDATEAERISLGYNASARLAGPDITAFTTVAQCLRRLEINAPEIFAVDKDHGFALIGDLGDALFARAFEQGADEEELYKSALDCLLHLHATFRSPSEIKERPLMVYDHLAMMTEVDLLPDWYLSWKAGHTTTLSKDALSDWHAAWQKVLGQLSPPATIVLRDFHAENLLWLPDEAGLARVGIIDFQDALYGQPAYDVVSLIEDARRDVGPALAETLRGYYKKNAAALLPAFDALSFERDYAILGAQRNAKILGIFARLVTRDHKPRYGDLVARVETHFVNNLRAPVLAPVGAWFKKYQPALGFSA